MANRRLLTSTAQPVVTSDNDDFYTADSADPSTFPVIFYTNTAERNRVNKSTYLSNANTINGTLRGECDLLNPTLDIYLTSVFSYNYAYIAKFSRYYFVTGVTSVRNDLWRVTLEYDALMTYKTKIVALSAFVERNEYLWTPNASDDIYRMSNKNTISVCLPSVPSRAGWVGSENMLKYPIDDTDKRFVVVMQGRPYREDELQRQIDIPPHFSLATIAMTQRGFRNFSYAASNDNSFLGSKTIYDCVLSSIVLPVEPECDEDVDDIPQFVALPGAFSSLNWILVAPKGRAIKSPYVSHSWRFTVSPWISNQSEWYKRYKPYRRYILRFLPFGEIEIDPQLITSNIFDLTARVSVLDGNTQLYIGSHYLASANCSLNLPMTKESVDIGKFGVGAITTALALGGLGGGAGALPLVSVGLGGAVSAIQNAAPDVSAKQGTYNYIDEYPTLFIYDAEQLDRAPALFGYPLYQTKTLNGLTGFTKVGRVHIEDLGNATQREKDDVERLLTEGVIL